MCLYIKLFGLSIPSYGLCILTGVILANVLVFVFLKRSGEDENDFIAMEGYILLGALLGSKLLYIIVSFKDIAWDRLSDPAYLQSLITSGFVFYGGLAGGLLFAFLSGKIHHFDSVHFMRKYIFAVPFAHAFGRLGCFMAGCCYGIPYDGIFAVTFPENSFAPSGISLFPVQLFEAVFLLLISAALLYLSIRKSFAYGIELYLLMYGVLRLTTENFRYDAARGFFLTFSTSQWISFIMIAAAAVSFMIRRRRMKRS